MESNTGSKSLILSHSSSSSNPQILFFLHISHFLMPLPIDRLSELPDAILCHILSLLPTKTSVATSILAKRWRFLWAYVPNLDFDFDDYEENIRNENHRIINRVLLLHKLPTLKSLRINIYMQDDFYDEYKVATWIIAAIARNVQHLHIIVPCHYALPSRLFSCETLVDLTLYDCGEIPTLERVCLPRLKKLYLQGVEYEDELSLLCLLFGSPVLEYLRIESNFKVHFGFSCFIFSPTVKRLYLESIVASLGPRKQGCVLEINTPAIEYLSVVDNLSGPIHFGDLTSLITADIYHRHDDMGIDMDEMGKRKSISLLKFVDNLSNVKCLKLDLSYTKINDSVFSAWTPSFDNLTKLELTADSCFLSKFLECANNLEILEVNELKEYYYHDFNNQRKGWIEPQQVPICLVSCLTTIKIGNIVGTEDGLKIVRYLLRNAKVLKSMDITYPHSIDSEAKNDLLQKISLFERVSEACELTFTEELPFSEASSNDAWDWERISV